jgi:very-short-patch-repair endonuclease
MFLLKIKRVIKLDFKKENRIIEFDGDYWHITEKSALRDKIRDKELKKMVYTILRIKENKYNKCPNNVVNSCLTFLGE